MKKTQAFLFVGATCLIMLGGLGAAGLLHLPKAEKEASPDSQKQAEKQSEQKKPQELIVGRWEGERDGVPEGLEFTDKGLVVFLTSFDKGTEKQIGGPIKLVGSYKFLDDKTLKAEFTYGGVKTTKSQVEVTKVSLKLTDEKKTMEFKRIQEFSAVLSQAD